MEEYFAQIAASPLFAGTAENDLRAMLGCLQARAVRLRRGTFLWHEGEPLLDVGLVLDGSVTLVREDYWGNRSILARVTPGQLFGEVYACLDGAAPDFAATASEESAVLLLNVRKATTVCTSACAFHTRLVQNLLRAVATNAYRLTRKIAHTSQRTTREKLLSYLSDCARQAGSASFEIPFNRQELADYLSVDRSAMSSELGRLRDAGVLRFSRNRFTLL